MSGIAGVFFLDGKPVEPAQLSEMTLRLHRRGPDGAATWLDGPVGLGHTRLIASPESRNEHQPLALHDGRYVITADARLDNRRALIERLGLHGAEPDAVGDPQVIIRAYERWGEACVDHLLGDFAFAVWDAGRRRLFCARDCFGVRPLFLHYEPGRLCVLASEPSAIFSFPDVPYRINEGRIADALISQLEGIDTACTFFEGIRRLPPAHAVTIDPGGLREWCYWRLEPGPELRLGSNEAYAEAFRELFTEAVGTRLRGTDSVGSMLSGGMDSGSIAAVAARLRIENGCAALPVFSAIGPEPDACQETRAVFAARAIDGLEPHSVLSTRLDDLLPELAELSSSLDEPFDCHMTLPRAMYLCARKCGIRALLDGIDGDTLLGEGSHVARLIRRGHWLTAWRQVVGQNRFWEGAYPAWREFPRSAWHAFAPAPIGRFVRGLREISTGGRLRRSIRKSLISQEFARRIGLEERLATLASHTPPVLSVDFTTERALAMGHPYLTVGVERYGRTASALGIEPRHPFLDRRLVEFCVALPGEQKLCDGWPKAILRRAMEGRLPDAVRWRSGKQHLGGAFNMALAQRRRLAMWRALEDGEEQLSAYADVARVRGAWRSFFDDGDTEDANRVFEAVALAEWLHRFRKRP